MLVSMVRFLAITHIIVGALLFIFGLADGVTSLLGGDKVDLVFFSGNAFFGLWTGTWTCIAGALGIPGSTPQRTPRRNCYAGLFLGFAITSAVFGGIIIIAYSTIISLASYEDYIVMERCTEFQKMDVTPSTHTMPNWYLLL
ncbi:uncharacterized protein LOC141860206 [Acropora palmata]|uniref:uncharacterized protein LOC141860206 n=1 Tax=Acropora palmata TaxID=6131 RepID=UPI003DA00414